MSEQQGSESKGVDPLEERVGGDEVAGEMRSGPAGTQSDRKSTPARIRTWNRRIRNPLTGPYVARTYGGELSVESMESMEC